MINKTIPIFALGIILFLFSMSSANAEIGDFSQTNELPLDEPKEKDINSINTSKCLELQNILESSYGSVSGDSNYNSKVDINKDGLVNIQDLAIFASINGNEDQCEILLHENPQIEGPKCSELFELLKSAYGSVSGDSNYNSKVDINKDGLVNIQDLAIFASINGNEDQCEILLHENPQIEGPKCSELFEVLKAAYNSQLGEFNFNTKVDFIKDNKINIADLAFFANNYNETWCDNILNPPSNQDDDDDDDSGHRHRHIDVIQESIVDNTQTNQAVNNLDDQYTGEVAKETEEVSLLTILGVIGLSLIAIFLIILLLLQLFGSKKTSKKRFK